MGEKEPGRVMLLWSVMFVLACGLSYMFILGIYYHPLGVDEKTISGVLVSYKEKESLGLMGKENWSILYIKINENDTVKLEFEHYLPSTIEIGVNYTFAYHTDPWDLMSTLDYYTNKN